jgi:hypothetical protein
MNRGSDGVGVVGALFFALALPAAAQSPPLAPALAPIGFLMGNWIGDDGKVAEKGGTSGGTSVFAPEVGGAVLIRRDHTELRDAQGKPSGGFDQIMLIYPEGGTLHADYSDGQHVIHYTEAKIVAGRSVVFTSSRVPGAPRFRLSYQLTAAEVVAIDFAMAPPGQDAFQPIAQGHLHRVGEP